MSVSRRIVPFHRAGRPTQEARTMPWTEIFSGLRQVVCRMRVGAGCCEPQQRARTGVFPKSWDRHDILGAPVGGRSMPSFFIRASSVVGLSPSRLARSEEHTSEL